MNLNEKFVYCWLCDASRNTGEGKLGNIFINKKFNTESKIYSVENIYPKNKKFFNVLNYKYISPFIGIFFCWFFYIKRQRVCYVNYLPLWNFFIFLLLPPRTILGPITGGAVFKKNKFRKIFFPYFYKISEFFLNIRSTQIIFSTDLLKVFLNNKTINKSKFKFINDFYLKKKILYNKINYKKNIDFLIYFRKHKNKQLFFPINFIKRLIPLGFKIHIVGDYLNLKGVINHKFLSNKKVEDMLSKSKFTIASGENIHSLFVLEAIIKKVIIIVPKNHFNEVNNFSNSFLFLNFNKINNFKELISLKNSF
ncbi:hypothetical protein MCEMSEM45_00233 [Candidatus Pelagibacterales bacterium]|jgi:hypothetical protein